MLLAIFCLEAVLLGLWYLIQRGDHFLGASILAKATANYGSIGSNSKVPVVGLAIIRDLILDSEPEAGGVPERLASVTAVLLLPVPTATPQLGTQTPSPTSRLLEPSPPSISSSPTITGTPKLTATPSPTGNPTLLSTIPGTTNTPAVSILTATPTATVQPSKTPAPTQGSPTPKPSSTSTPLPAQSPTPTPTDEGDEK